MSTRTIRELASPHGDEALCQTQGRSLCPVLAAIDVIGTEWRLAIVHTLLDGPKRFSELLRSNSKLNAKTLSATLKFLETTSVVQRTVVSTRPFVVVYALTEMGLGLAPAARELRAWGEKWLITRAHAKPVRPTTPRSHVIEPALPPIQPDPAALAAAAGGRHA